MKTYRNKKITTTVIIITFIVAMFFPLVQSQIGNIHTPTSRNQLNWWNTEWPYRKLITINHTKIISDLINFPVLISLPSDPDLADATQTTGQDIVFIQYVDNTSIMNHEIEFYNHTNGQLVTWVKMPSLSATSDTKLWMYYGNSICGDQQHIEATWDTNFLTVQHLEETTGALYDSTNYHNDGVPAGNLTMGIAGKIDGADGFDGVDDHITLPQGYTNENQFTMEAWIYPETGARNFLSQWNNYFGVFLQVGATPNHIEFYIDSTAGAIGNITLDTWYQIVLTYNGTAARIYRNGGTSTGIVCNPPTWPAEGLYISDRSQGSRRFHGTIDEVRLSNIARSSAWISTEFNNQNDTSNFFTIDAEEQYPYILTISVVGQGTITKNPDQPSYPYGSIVTLTAIPDAGWSFNHWSGDLTGNQNPINLIINHNKSVTAVFLLENHPPIAKNDTATVHQNSTNNQIDVLANDSDPDGDNLIIISVRQPTFGASSNDNSYVYYTPNTGYHGADSFTYTISDGNGGTATGTVFITVLPSNENNTSPYQPSQPVPDNGETNVSITTNIMWIGGDPDPGDTVTYDVYFGTTTTPPKLSSNQTNNTFDLSILTYETTYYWRIVSWDNHKASTPGPLWSFTSQEEQHEEGIINVTITRPLNHTVYLRNIRLLSLPKLSLPRTTFIYGPITIATKVTTTNTSVDRVEFYIDGKLKKSDDTTPYNYRWAPLKSFKHKIQVKAYSTDGQIAIDEITVFKWRLHPIILLGGAVLLTSN